MTSILYYRKSTPLTILKARPVSSEDAENWVREMNDEHPDFHYYIAE